ncbi:ATP synthase F1 subunit delta [Robertkochia aurantiaca]|uniref:ATP synthase F1 subunit delta n=1 Tax=Robertkochia aurantiaca TaxID=2873700 RepID=UPI001CCDA0FC|nr:ATP synthase F1 subunit delta [Robertkochia sp. 3YJGBD-33]
MTGNRASNRYAKALIGYAQDNNLLEGVFNDMNHVVKTLGESEELMQLIQSPIVKSETKNDALKSVFAAFDKASFNLIDLLIANNRIELLPMVAQRYTELYDELKGKQVATVTTAVPLSQEMENKILEKVSTLTGKEVILKKKVDADLIGGFILRVGDKEYNASISNKLNTLKRKFYQSTSA